MICLVIPTLSLLLFIQSLYFLSKLQVFYLLVLVRGTAGLFLPMPKGGGYFVLVTMIMDWRGMHCAIVMIFILLLQLVKPEPCSWTEVYKTVG